MNLVNTTLREKEAGRELYGLQKPDKPELCILGWNVALLHTSSISEKALYAMLARRLIGESAKEHACKMDL